MVDLDEFESIGSDITLGLSLAFCRAIASTNKMHLVDYLLATTGFSPKIPFPLVNIFSGGIHAEKKSIPFQQIMIAAKHESFLENAQSAILVFNKIEKIYNEKVYC